MGFLTGLRLAILHGLHVRIDNRFLSEALAECIFDEAGGGVCFVDSGLSIHAKVYLNGAIGSDAAGAEIVGVCLLYTSPSPRDDQPSRMPSSA